MNTAKELKTITGLVKDILEKNTQARNSDSVLYLKVLERLASEKGIDLQHLTVPALLLCGKELGLPGFETVRRTRQKAQAEFPELSGNKDIQAFRAANEEVFREYARAAVE